MFRLGRAWRGALPPPVLDQTTRVHFTFVMDKRAELFESAGMCDRQNRHHRLLVYFGAEIQVIVVLRDD